MNDNTPISYLDERIRSCEDATLRLQEKVADLERRYLDMQNDLSLMASLQRSHLELAERVERLERPKPVTNSTTYTPHTVSFGSVAELVKSVEQLFDCKDGDYRAYHTECGLDGNVSYFRYEVLGAIAGGPDAQEMLRQQLYTAFRKIREAHPSERPVLYWRHAAEERVQEERAEGTDLYKIRARIAIPGADFSVISPILAKEGQPFVTLKSHRV